MDNDPNYDVLPEDQGEGDRVSQAISTSMVRKEMAFRDFMRVYELSNPRPNYGWMTKITAIAIVALTMVAALRTAFSFGLSAFTSLNQFLANQIDPNALLFLSGLESFAAILGIEGFIIVTGMKIGMQKSEEELKAPRAIASYILLAVSCAAGMFQNASMLDAGTLQTSEWILMLITALGIPVSLMFASPYLGLMLNYQVLKYKEWLDTAREQFNGTNLNRLAMGDVNQLVAEQKRALKYPRQARTHHESQPGERVRNIPLTHEIVAWYRQIHGLRPGQFIKGSDVAEEYYQANNLTPVDGDLDRLAGAIRVYLHREREK